MTRYLLTIIGVLVFSIGQTTVFAQTTNNGSPLGVLQGMSAEQKKNLAARFGVDLSSSGGLSDPGIESIPQDELFPKSRRSQDEDAPKSPIAKRFEDLQNFGYELFKSSPSTFAPVGSIPAPENYIIGAGDRFHVLFFGKESNDFLVTVDRDGAITIPEIGRFIVQGLSFNALRELISTRVRERKIGVDVSVTLDELRSIQVFVLGEVSQPGSFAVSSLSTATNALFVAGGVTERGSLRTIQVKRDGKVVADLDLYDLMLKGDISGDRRLRQGDVVFVPSVGSQVAISGEVNRAAIFEVSPGESLQDVLDFASGFSGFAYTKDVRLSRTIDGVRRVSKSLSENDLKNTRPFSGDFVEVLPVSIRPEASIEIAGLVARPGYFEWDGDTSLYTIFKDRSDLLLPAEQCLVVVEHFSGERPIEISVLRGDDLFRIDRLVEVDLKQGDKITVVPVSQTENERKAYYLSKERKLLENALEKNPDIDFADNAFGQNFQQQQQQQQQQQLNQVDDPFMQLLMANASGDAADDEISADPLVASRQARISSRLDLISQGIMEPVDLDQPFVDRQKYFDDLVSTIEGAASFGEPGATVVVRGEVREPGVYPLTRGQKVSDLILLSGGLGSEADSSAIELVQRTKQGFSVNRVTPGNVTLPGVISAGSELIVRKDQDQIQLPAVTVAGFVKYPGTYRMPKGSTLSDLVERAGGVTDEGDLRAAIFSRKTLREKEKAELKRLRAETESALAQQAVQGSALGRGDAAGAIRSSVELSKLLQQAEDTQAVGRLVINLPAVLAGQLEQDVILEDGDALAVPGIRQSVTVLGEVLYPTSHIYELGLTPDEYLRKSGGVNRRADEGRAYIIRANGAVEPLLVGNILTRQVMRGVTVQPGDTIVIPRDVDDVPTLQLWTAITQIVYQSAIALAAIGNI